MFLKVFSFLRFLCFWVLRFLVFLKVFSFLRFFLFLGP